MTHSIPGTTFIQDPNDSQSRAILFTAEKWQNLKTKVKKDEIEANNAAKREQYIKSRQALSREMAKTWENTIINIRKKRFEEKREKLRKIEEEKNVRYKEMRDEEKSLREAIRKGADDKMYLEKDSVKALSSALRLAETLREREAQINFEKKLQEIEKGREEVYIQKLKDDVQCYYKEQAEAKQQQAIKKKMLNKEKIKELKEAEEKKRKEKQERIAEEVKDLEIARKEMEQLKQNQKLEAEKRKVQKFEDVLANQELLLEKERTEQEQAKEENTAIHLVAEAKKELAKIRKQRELEMQTDAIARRQRIVDKISSSIKTKDEKDEARYEKARDQKEAIYLDRLKKEIEYRNRLRQERIDYFEECRKKEERKKYEERELYKWNILKRFKQDELNKLYVSKGIERRKMLRKKLEEFWFKQMDEHNLEYVKERQDEIDTLRRITDQWDFDDKQFLQYAEDLCNESRKKGRPLLPLERSIHDFKDRNGLLEKPRRHPVFESNFTVSMPTASNSKVL